MIPSAGTGEAPCHHGEILQGAFRDRTGRISLGLVTLSLPATDALGSRAEFTPCPEAPAGRLTVHPPDRVKALRAAASTIAECARRSGRTPCGGRLLLRGAVPVGLGMGSSTSDIIATIRAVAAGYRVALTAPEVARLAVAAEHACDPPHARRRAGSRPVRPARGTCPRSARHGAAAGRGRRLRHRRRRTGRHPGPAHRRLPRGGRDHVRETARPAASRRHHRRHRAARPGLHRQRPPPPAAAHQGGTPAAGGHRGRDRRGGRTDRAQRQCRRSALRPRSSPPATTDTPLPPPAGAHGPDHHPDLHDVREHAGPREREGEHACTTTSPTRSAPPT